MPRTSRTSRPLLALSALAAAGLLAACSSGTSEPAAATTSTTGASTETSTTTTTTTTDSAAPVNAPVVSGVLKDTSGKEVGTVEIRAAAEGSAPTSAGDSGTTESVTSSATSSTSTTSATSATSANPATAPNGMEVRVVARGLPAGFHGLHVHSVGKCEPNSPDPTDTTKMGDFLSAGGHLAGGGADHPDHAGDLPSLEIGQDGTASLVTVTSRLTPDLFTGSKGTSLIVHAMPDNYANIPTRYAGTGADAESKKAGDAGARIACAVLAKP